MCASCDNLVHTRLIPKALQRISWLELGVHTGASLQRWKAQASLSRLWGCQPVGGHEFRHAH